MLKLVFEPKQWHACTDNDWKTCSKGINCYSYALNQPKYYWSVPGLGYIKSTPQIYFDSFNDYFKDVSPEEYRRSIIDGAISDGLIRVDSPVDKEGYYLTALFFNDDPENYDLDWYRKDDDGFWSHKDGRHAATNKDSKGNLIRDPRNSIDLHYPTFGSFFLVPRQGVKLVEKFLLLNQP